MASFDLRNNGEKRNFLRIEINTPVEVLYESKTLVGNCKDLSATGLQVEMPIALSLNTQVTVCITPNDMGEKLPPFRARATVARLVPNEDNETTYGFIIDEILE